MTREPAPVRVTDEQVEWLIKAQATGYSAAWDLRGLLLDLREARAALAAMTVERDGAQVMRQQAEENALLIHANYRAQLAEVTGERNRLIKALAWVYEKEGCGIQEALYKAEQAALAGQRGEGGGESAAMRSTPVGKLMADRDELTQDVQRLMRERDRLRGLVVEMVEGNGTRTMNPSWSERADAALAVHGQRGEGADAGTARADKGVRSPSRHAERADLLALLKRAHEALHDFEPVWTKAKSDHIVGEFIIERFDPVAADIEAALAAWEART